jgi:ABC-type glycerol-3-phosphate transport system substrate-binding protein
MRSGGEKSEPAIYVDRPAEWEQETGNTLKLEPIPGGKDYIPKVDSLAASNTIGDSLWTSDVWAEHTHLVKFNIIEPVDSYLPKYNVKRDEWFKAITDTLTYNGKMYGLPKTGHPGDSYVGQPEDVRSGWHQAARHLRRDVRPGS